MKKKTKPPFLDPTQWRQRGSDFWDRAGKAPELFFQFLFTYGVMTVIVALSICIYLLSPFVADPTVQEADIWAIIINSYMPTTITFVGVILFSDGFISKHKLRGVLLELLVVSLALAYIAFVSVNDVAFDFSSTYKVWILDVIRYLNLLLMIPAIALIPDVYSVITGKDVKPRSDGRIYF